MFEIFKEPKIDFMGKTRLWVGISLVLVVFGLVVLFTRGLNLGIEFKGGSEIQVKYASAPDIGAIRDALGGAGFANHVVTTIGKPEENEVHIRIGLDRGGAEKATDPTPIVVDALRTDEAKEKLASGMVDVNSADESSLRSLFESSPEIARDEAARLAAALIGHRTEHAIFSSAAEAGQVPGMMPQAAKLLEARAFAGPFAVRSQSFVGPVIGRELANKALLAILGSLAGMLVYIWLRFQVQWGVAAVIALTHDTIVTLGFFSLMRLEMSLPVVAAFLTLIGYSVNDTVVVFDRIRENLKLRAGDDLSALVNHSINQTLSRTILTSGLTWTTCIFLFLFGGEALRPFSFVLSAGIIIGTYSSIYIASPILVLWKQYLDRKKATAPEAKTAPAGRPARKVRSGGSGRGNSPS